MKYIFIHGLGQTDKDWDRVILNFDSNQVHCPNLYKLLSHHEMSYESLYHCFQNYCDGFSEPLNLCGLSLGGILALNYAIDFPDKVSTLVLIGTPYKMPRGLLRLQNIAFRLIPNRLFDNAGFLKNDFFSLTNSMRNLDFTDSLSSIICNSLIICGEKDRFNKKATIRLSKKLKNSKRAFVEDAKHEVNKDNPERLYQVMKNFYDEIL